MWRWHEAGAGPGPGTWEIWTEPLCNLFVVFILLVVVLVFQSVLLMSKLCDKLLTHFSEGTLVHTSHQSVYVEKHLEYQILDFLIH